MIFALVLPSSGCAFDHEDQVLAALVAADFECLPPMKPHTDRPLLRLRNAFGFVAATCRHGFPVYDRVLHFAACFISGRIQEKWRIIHEGDTHDILRIVPIGRRDFEDITAEVRK